MYSPGTCPVMVSEQTQNIRYASLNLAGKRKITSGANSMKTSRLDSLLLDDLKSETLKTVRISELSVFTSSMYLPHLPVVCTILSIFFQSFSL